MAPFGAAVGDTVPATVSTVPVASCTIGAVPVVAEVSLVTTSCEKVGGSKSARAGPTPTPMVVTLVTVPTGVTLVTIAYALAVGNVVDDAAAMLTVAVTALPRPSMPTMLTTRLATAPEYTPRTWSLRGTSGCVARVIGVALVGAAGATTLTSSAALGACQNVFSLSYRKNRQPELSSGSKKAYCDGCRTTVASAAGVRVVPPGSCRFKGAEAPSGEMSVTVMGLPRCWVSGESDDAQLGDVLG